MPSLIVRLGFGHFYNLMRSRPVFRDPGRWNSQLIGKMSQYEWGTESTLAAAHAGAGEMLDGIHRTGPAVDGF
ncbi:MAG: hypothetical protein P8185_23895 [Deltaproteobacteria bacterium]